MFEFITSLFFKNNKNTLSKNSPNMEIETISKYQRNFDVNDITTINPDDYLGLAANANNRAKIEIKNKNYEKAWELFLEKQQYFFQHAEKQNFTACNTIALDASVSEDFANILRLENNHKQALVHMIYCVAGEYPTVKYKATKLLAYFNRAKLNNVTFKELEDFIFSLRKPPDYRAIQDKVKEWLEK